MNRPVCALGIAATMLVACRSPTQISVTVQTKDVACSAVTTTSFTSGELVVVEDAPPTTESTTCSGDGHLGTLVLVPSEDDNAEVGFKVVTALNGESVETCAKNGAGNANCIVARRAIRYLPHTPLNVIVDMTLACEGVVCDPHSTCVNAFCKNATISDPSACEGSGCDSSVLAPAPDAGIDATVPDATVDAAVADATTDATLPSEAGDASSEDAALPDSSEPIEAATFDAMVVGCDLGGLQQGAPYPMEAYCPNGRSRSPLVGPAKTPTPVQKWSVDLNGYGYASPSISADGTIYVASVGLPSNLDSGNGYSGGAVQALHPDGGPYWTYAPDAGASFDQVPVIAADSTLRFWDLAGPDYTVLALDGSVRTLVRESAGARGGVTIVSGGTMYLPNGNGDFLALDNDGGVLWSVPGITDDFCFPSVGANGVIFSEDDRSKANAFLPDGSVLWPSTIDSGANEAGAALYLSPVVVAPDGTLRLYDGNGFLWSLDPQTGQGIWDKPFANAGDIGGLAVSDDGTTYLGTREGLFAIEPTAGGTVHTALGSFGAPVIDANGDVYAFCNNTDVCSFDSALVLRWDVPLLSPLGYDPGAKPVIGPGGMLYIITTNVHVAGKLHAIGAGP